MTEDMKSMLERILEKRNNEILGTVESGLEYVRYKTEVAYLVATLNVLFMHPHILDQFLELLDKDRVYQIGAYLAPANSEILKIHRINLMTATTATLKQMSVLTYGAFDWETHESESGDTFIFIYFHPKMTAHAVKALKDLGKKEYPDEEAEEDYGTN